MQKLVYSLLMLSEAERRSTCEHLFAMALRIQRTFASLIAKITFEPSNATDCNATELEKSSETTLVTAKFGCCSFRAPGEEVLLMRVS